MLIFPQICANVTKSGTDSQFRNVGMWAFGHLLARGGGFDRCLDLSAEYYECCLLASLLKICHNIEGKF